MTEEKLKEMLNELAVRAVEPVRTKLAEDLKGHIPAKLASQRAGLDSINIIIDLRISKLAAAAAIIITMILCANFLGGRQGAGEGIYQDGKLLMKYWFAGDDGKSEASACRSIYEYLVQKGKEVAYYGDSIDPEDSNAVLLQWKLSDGRYRVIFGDLREKTVTAEQLIKLQSKMLQNKSK